VGEVVSLTPLTRDIFCQFIWPGWKVMVHHVRSGWARRWSHQVGVGPVYQGSGPPCPIKVGPPCQVGSGATLSGLGGPAGSLDGPPYQVGWGQGARLVARATCQVTCVYKYTCRNNIEATNAT
jgi:hypothetical protein